MPSRCNHLPTIILGITAKKGRFVDVRFLFVVAMTLGGIACVGVPAGDSGRDESAPIAEVPAAEEDGAADQSPVAGPVEPIPVVDFAEPTPVNDRTDAAPELNLVWMPGVGYAAPEDLYDLMLIRGLGGASLPFGFTHLELLCRDQGYTDAYCRSRFGGF